MRPANPGHLEKSFWSGRINMRRKEWRFVSLGILLGALLVTSRMTAEGGINSWTSIGPEGGAIAALAIDPMTPGVLYAAAGGGVFKSTNGGASWSAVNTGLPNSSYVSVLAIDPQTPATLYAGTYGGLFKSYDGGGGRSGCTTSAPKPCVVCACR